jgi:hypothetical protein
MLYDATTLTMLAVHILYAHGPRSINCAQRFSFLRFPPALSSVRRRHTQANDPWRRGWFSGSSDRRGRDNGGRPGREEVRVALHVMKSLLGRTANPPDVISTWRPQGDAIYVNSAGGEDRRRHAGYQTCPSLSRRRYAPLILRSFLLSSVTACS